MVARIAPEPISTGLAVPDFRSRPVNVDVHTQQDASTSEALLKPVPAPVPAPVPGPAIVSAGEAFAAALIAERMTPRTPTPSEVRLRFSTDWKAPSSALKLTDREA